MKNLKSIEVINPEIVKIKIQVLTPDGQPIFNEAPYKNMLEAESKFEEWKSKFKFDTYYYSIKYGQIPISILKKYCSFNILKTI